MTEHNHRKREQMKTQKSKSETQPTYYGAGGIVAIGVLGVIDCYICQSKIPQNKPEESPVNQPKESPVLRPKETPDNNKD